MAGAVIQRGENVACLNEAKNQNENLFLDLPVHTTTHFIIIIAGDFFPCLNASNLIPPLYVVKVEVGWVFKNK